MIVTIGQLVELPDGYYANGAPRPSRLAKIVRFHGPDSWVVCEYCDSGETITISPRMAQEHRYG